MTQIQHPVTLTLLIINMLFLLPAANACTDARIVAMDGSVITARSMEFGMPLATRLVIRPRGSRLESSAPSGKQGLKFVAKYGYVYMDALSLDVVTDGLNEAGLGFGALYLPGFAEYEDLEATDNTPIVSNLKLGAWILSQFASVDEVKAEIGKVKVWGEAVQDFNNACVPLHFVVHDASGQSIVLEWVGGELKIYDKTVGVLTNSPPYDWQMLNLRNYVNLSPTNSRPTQIEGITYPSTGQGSGLVGLPGDPSPPSRLVQTVITLSSVDKPKDHIEGLVLGQKLMNRVDLPAGLAIDPDSGESDITQWVVFRDHGNKTYYYRTYEDMTLNALDLKTLDLSPSGTPRRMPIASIQPTLRMIAPESIPDLKE